MDPAPSLQGNVLSVASSCRTLWSGERHHYHFANTQTCPSRESLYKFWVKVEGLTYTELRHVSERLGEQAERMRHVVMECLFSLMMDVTMCSERETVAEFSVPTWCLLNSLEGIGYRVTSNLIKFVLPSPSLNLSPQGCDQRSVGVWHRHV